MNKSLRITLSAAVLTLLAGCGAKGPLILPEKAVPIEAPAETVPATTPDSVPPVDDPKTGAPSAEPQAGDATEPSLSPAKDD